jgi:hypothetical protein
MVLWEMLGVQLLSVSVSSGLLSLDSTLYLALFDNVHATAKMMCGVACECAISFDSVYLGLS